VNEWLNKPDTPIEEGIKCFVDWNHEFCGVA